MNLSILHKTQYDFDVPPQYGLQQIRLTPKSRPKHIVKSWEIDVIGGNIEAEYIDFNNNHTHLIRLDDGSNSLSIICKGEIFVSQNDGVLGPHNSYVPLWYFERTTPLTTAGKKLRRFIRKFEFEPDQKLCSLHKLSEQILQDVSYEVGETGIETSAEMAMTLGKGVCQDHAHIFVCCARQLGMSARYVSGYLMMDDRVIQDATHAWAEVWVDGLGWVGFDVSNQISPNEKYVRVASGLDYREAAPISGMIYGPTRESINVELRVQQQ